MVCRSSEVFLGRTEDALRQNLLRQLAAKINRTQNKKVYLAFIDQEKSI